MAVKAANGFAALAELDSNQDGRVDAQDTSFSHLHLWQGTDANADVGDGELRALDAAGVQSLSLTYRTQRVTDGQGNQLLQVGSYTKADYSLPAMAAAPQLGAAPGDSRFGLFSQPLMTSGSSPTGAASFW